MKNYFVLLFVLMLFSCESSKKLTRERLKIIKELNELNNNLERTIAQNDSLLKIELDKLPQGVVENEKKLILAHLQQQKEEHARLSQRIEQSKKAILEKNTESLASQEIEKIKKDASNLHNNLEKLKGIKVVANELSETVGFETAKYKLKEQGKKQLLDFVDNIEQRITNNPANVKISLTVHGYTDNTGTTQTNQSLSENRANTVYTFLYDELKKNIGINIVGTKEGFGETKCPPKQNCNERQGTNNAARRICIVYVLITRGLNFN